MTIRKKIGSAAQRRRILTQEEKRLVNLAKVQAAEGCSPLEILQKRAEILWKLATEKKGFVDLDILEEAASAAKDVAPYLHAKPATLQNPIQQNISGELKIVVTNAPRDANK